MQDLLRDLQDALVEGLAPGRRSSRCGPFLVLWHPSESIRWLNQAVPLAKAGPVDARRLIEQYRERGLTPFIEFFPELWPGLGEALESAGFHKEHSAPLMALSRGGWVPQPTEARPPGRDEVAEFLAVGSQAFGMDGEAPTDTEAAWQALESGRVLCAGSWEGGRMASVGQAVGTDRIRELAGLGTLAEWRRRGHCTAVIRRLLHDFFSRGGETAWLTPGDEGAEAVYAKAGFRPIATMEAWSAESA